MKRFFYALCLLPLVLLYACSEEQLEMMPPYIFFTYDEDTYVIDADNPNPADYTIRGSISAEAGFRTFVMGDEVLEKDILGDSLNMMFNHTVSLQGKTQDFDVDFTLTDLLGNTVSKPFHFVMSHPIETLDISMGAQNNAFLGFFFSYADRKVYSLPDMMKMGDPQGFCFGFNNSKKVPMLLSPTELINQIVLNDYKGTHISSFCEVTAYQGVSFSKAMFDAITNDAFLRNLNKVEYGTLPYVEISAGKGYLFKNEDDSLRGIIYINTLESGISGQLTATIKIQQQ